MTNKSKLAAKGKHFLISPRAGCSRPDFVVTYTGADWHLESVVSSIKLRGGVYSPDGKQFFPWHTIGMISVVGKPK